MSQEKMIHPLTHTNESFGFLSRSSEFLNHLLNNINCCILLLNKNLELQAYNNALKTIFPYKSDEKLLYMKCGEVIGCAYNIEEAKDCGKTTFCNFCELRESALKSYIFDEIISKQKFTRPFYSQDKNLVIKNLQYSTRLFKFKQEKYIIMIIEEVISN